MNYFQPYSLPADQAVLAAWDSQLAELADCPALDALAKQRELFPRFAEYYSQFRALPRGTRRALQRKLARARELVSIQPEWQRRLASSVAGAALLLALAQSVNAATITVTTDKPDINDNDGKCSLIEAIINANDDAATHPDCAAGSGADTIVLPKDSTITLTEYYTDYFGYTGLPVITSAIVVEGNRSTVARKSDASVLRLFAISSSGDLALNNISLTGGSLFSEYYYTGSGYNGGAIYNGGRLKITRTIISGNKSLGNGGAIHASHTAITTIDNSIITENTAYNYYSGGGGVSNLGTLVILNSSISGNSVGILPYTPWCESSGGGIYNLEGTISIQNSIISNNKAQGCYSNGDGFGGGIDNEGGVVFIKNSSLLANSGKYSGGGILSEGILRTNLFGEGLLLYKAATLNVENSLISGNFGHGIYDRGSNTLVANSTISNNVVEDYGGAGIRNDEQSRLEIVNSTISGNILKGDKGYGFNGAGIGNFYRSTAIIKNSTVSKNIAIDAYGGGIGNHGTLVVSNSLISGNQASVGREIWHDNLYGGFRNINKPSAKAELNVFGINGDSGVVGFTPSASNVVPTVPLKSILAPLKDNGGPTLTHALVKGSPAIDAAPLDANCPATDQRGVTRTGGCDIGAVEYTAKTSKKNK
jgi:Right handed beta helix region